IVDTGDSEVEARAFDAMAQRFDGRAGAFAYLLFVLLYFPCAATIGAIKRETGTPWAAFVALWTTLVAYVTASVFYQIATFDAHPTQSTAWITGLLATFAAVVGVIMARSRTDQPAARPSTASM
ncbi:MAG: ferrous iron transporter B, partial [Proteobacteria bacterium]